MMDTIARQTEGHLWAEEAFGRFLKTAPVEPPLPVENAVAEATATLSRDLRVRCIIVLSRQGRSISVVSGSRPAAPIIGVTFGTRACQLSHLQWGVIPRDAPDANGEVEEIRIARILAAELELASPGHFLLLVRGFSDDPAFNNPSVTVVSME